MIQQIIVFLIVGVAVGYMFRNLYRKFMGEGGCGCRGCEHSSVCNDNHRNESGQLSGR